MEKMYRSICLSLLFGTAASFGDGPECVDAGWVGNCVQISDCTTGEWVFGVRESPVCDVVGANSNLDSALVCCFDTIATEE
jgi:hypothetical protein